MATPAQAGVGGQWAQERLGADQPGGDVAFTSAQSAAAAGLRRAKKGPPSGRGARRRKCVRCRSARRSVEPGGGVLRQLGRAAVDHRSRDRSSFCGKALETAASLRRHCSLGEISAEVSVVMAKWVATQADRDHAQQQRPATTVSPGARRRRRRPAGPPTPSACRSPSPTRPRGDSRTGPAGREAELPDGRRARGTCRPMPSGRGDSQGFDDAGRPSLLALAARAGRAAPRAGRSRPSAAQGRDRWEAGPPQLRRLRTASVYSRPPAFARAARDQRRQPAAPCPCRMFGRAETGWEVYMPRRRRRDRGRAGAGGRGCSPRALARWQGAHATCRPTAWLTPETLAAAARHPAGPPALSAGADRGACGQRRPGVASCPDPPDEATLAWTTPEESWGGRPEPDAPRRARWPPGVSMRAAAIARSARWRVRCRCRCSPATAVPAYDARPLCALERRLRQRAPRHLLGPPHGAGAWIVVLDGVRPVDSTAAAGPAAPVAVADLSVAPAQRAAVRLRELPVRALALGVDRRARAGPARPPGDRPPADLTSRADVEGGGRTGGRGRA